MTQVMMLYLGFMVRFVKNVQRAKLVLIPFLAKPKVSGFF